ncbi:MAG TPA: lipid A biosynthesis acyltransferase [Burkholderiales bacterium]|nr:lipid A biosynthesis acyltransferase [Burkholderiales bacterium]
MSRLAIGLVWLLHFLPLGAQAALGNALGNLLYALAASRRRVTLRNLERCFPERDGAARRRLARAHFRALVRAFLEHGLLWWAPRERLERLIRVEGLEHARALRGEAAVFLVPHFVTLDACATRLTMELDMVGIYAMQKDPHFARLLEHGRTRFGSQRAVSRQEGVRAMISAMRREKRSSFYLPDQDPGDKNAVFVPFFGVSAATLPGLSRIARLTGAPVLSAVVRMLPGGQGYVLRIGPRWEDFPTEDLEADTRRMNAWIEQAVREAPEQYLWSHRRFKTRPPGEAPFYGRD